MVELVAGGEPVNPGGELRHVLARVIRAEGVQANR